MERYGIYLGWMIYLHTLGSLLHVFIHLCLSGRGFLDRDKCGLSKKQNLVKNLPNTPKFLDVAMF